MQRHSRQVSARRRSLGTPQIAVMGAGELAARAQTAKEASTHLGCSPEAKTAPNPTVRRPHGRVPLKRIPELLSLVARRSLEPHHNLLIGAMSNPVKTPSQSFDSRGFTPKREIIYDPEI